MNRERERENLNKIKSYTTLLIDRLMKIITLKNQQKKNREENKKKLEQHEIERYCVSLGFLFNFFVLPSSFMLI